MELLFTEMAIRLSCGDISEPLDIQASSSRNLQFPNKHPDPSTWKSPSLGNF